MQELIAISWWTLSSVQLLQNNAAATQQLIDVFVAFGIGGVCIGTISTTVSKALLSASICCCVQHSFIHLLAFSPTHSRPHPPTCSPTYPPTHPPTHTSASTFKHQTRVFTKGQTVEGVSRFLYLYGTCCSTCYSTCCSSWHCGKSECKPVHVNGKGL